MNSIIYPSDDANRLTLALLLALALHAVLMFAIPAERWSFPKLRSLRFEAVLLPPTTLPPTSKSAPNLAPQPEIYPNNPPTSLPSTLPPLASIPPVNTAPSVPTTPALKPSLPQESLPPMPVSPHSMPPRPALALTSHSRPALARPNPTPKPIPKKPLAAAPPAPPPALATKTATRSMRRTEAAHANTTPPSRITAPPSKSSADSLTEAAVSAPFATATSAANTFESPEWAREPVRAQENLPANKSGSNKSGTVNRGRRGRLDSSALLGQVAGLDAETQRRANASTRSKRVNPNDMQSLEGFYMAAWVRKVERIGEMNFPEAAHQSNSSRGPVLDVSIRADGSVQSIRIVRSSGNSELDQAAQRIVRLGAPYAAFSPELRQKYDVLSIIRPWRFEPSGQVQMR